MKTTADEMPAEIDFRNAKRGVHYINSEASVFVPAAIKEGAMVVCPDAPAEPR